MNRVRHFFIRQAEAHAYFEMVLRDFPHSDPICVENINAEDKARGYPHPRINGYDVIHADLPELKTERTRP